MWYKRGAFGEKWGNSANKGRLGKTKKGAIVTGRVLFPAITPEFRGVCRHCPRTAAARSASAPSASPATRGCAAPSGPPRSPSYFVPRRPSGPAGWQRAEASFAKRPGGGGRCKAGGSRQEWLGRRRCRALWRVRFHSAGGGFARC